MFQLLCEHIVHVKALAAVADLKPARVLLGRVTTAASSRHLLHDLRKANKQLRILLHFIKILVYHFDEILGAAVYFLEFLAGLNGKYISQLARL